MLFSDAPKALVQKIEQVVKLIRSKGVGIYFVTQSPSDIPDSVLAQLSNRVQHALRAYTPAEQKAVRAAAASLRANPDFKAEDVIMELGVGKALVSVLDENGVPGIVQHTSILCPQSLMAPCDAAVRADCLAYDGMGPKYDKSVDNISAYESLNQQKESDAEKEALQKELEETKKQLEKEQLAAQKKAEKEAAAKEREAERKRQREEAAREKAAQKRKDRIEKEIISAGSQILKRGLLSTLKKRW